MGSSVSSVCEFYDVGKSTVYDLIKKKEQYDNQHNTRPFYLKIHGDLVTMLAFRKDVNTTSAVIRSCSHLYLWYEQSNLWHRAN